MRFSDTSRAFLDLWFAKPMFCMQVAFHENDGYHKNDEHNSDSYKQGAKCWISGNHNYPQIRVKKKILHNLVEPLAAKGFGRPPLPSVYGTFPPHPV